MKKIVFPMIVALVATFSFTSCGPTDPDQKLEQQIIKIKDYVGTDSDNDAVSASFTSTGFIISYDDPEYADVTYGGTWKVEDGWMIMTGDELWSKGTIEPDGKALTLVSGTLTFNLVKK